MHRAAGTLGGEGTREEAQELTKKHLLLQATFSHLYEGCNGKHTPLHIATRPRTRVWEKRKRARMSTTDAAQERARGMPCRDCGGGGRSRRRCSGGTVSQQSESDGAQASTTVSATGTAPANVQFQSRTQIEATQTLPGWALGLIITFSVVVLGLACVCVYLYARRLEVARKLSSTGSTPLAVAAAAPGLGLGKMLVPKQEDVQGVAKGKSRGGVE